MVIFDIAEDAIRIRAHDSKERALIRRWSRGRAVIIGSGIETKPNGMKSEVIAIGFVARKPIKPRKRLEVHFAWFDLWIGAYIDVEGKAIYICPLPMLLLRISYA